MKYFSSNRLMAFLFFFLVLVCFAIAGFNYQIIIDPSAANEKKVQLFLSFLNPLLTIVSIVALLLVYFIQNNILAESKRVSEAQFKSLRIQKFETTFFNMIERLDLIIKDERGQGKGKFVGIELVGRDYLRNIMADYVSILKANIPNTDSKTMKNIILREFIPHFQNEHSNYIRYYFYLYNILKYITNEFRNKDLSIINEENESFMFKYLLILKATLSQEELALIFYNYITVSGDIILEDKELTKMIDELGLLEFIDESYFLYSDYKVEFPKTKFRYV